MGDTSVALGGHDLLAWRDTAEPPRCGEYSPSLTETEFFLESKHHLHPLPQDLPAFGTLHHTVCYSGDKGKETA